MQMVHLHTHQQYSLLDGMYPSDKWAARAKKLGMPALGLTDHGNMHGTYIFYKACKKAGIKPIIGCELYIYDKRMQKNKEHAYKYGHVILIAKNAKGYKNLCKIVTDAYLKGLYYKPQTDRKMLKKHKDGLIVTSACTGGTIGKLIQAGKLKKAKKLIQWYHKTFGDDFYLEIQAHDFPGQHEVNHFLLRYAKACKIQVLTTNDSHYLAIGDSYIHQVLLLAGTKGTIEELNRGDKVFKFPCNTYDLPTAKELIKRYKKHSYFKKYKRMIIQSIKNTIKIANKCDVEIPSKIELPRYRDAEGEEVPKSKIDKLLKAYCKRGWINKILTRKDPDNYRIRYKKYRKQLKYELDAIIRMGLADYFLIVADFVGWSKKQGIKVGPARGSVAGCLVAYLLDITDIDPIKFDLMFERFLNPSRTGVGNIPDIDLDFQHDRRDEVKKYIARKYGEKHVAAIATFFQMGIRSAFKDVGRVFGIPYEDLNEITQNIYTDETVEDVLEKDMSIDLKILEKEKPEFMRCVKTLAGHKRHESIHAAGLIVANKPLVNYCPLFKKGKDSDVIACQWDMYDLTERGLLKLDLLGLKNLTVIGKAEKLISKEIDREFHVEEISLEDEKVFDQFKEGKTGAIFQFERAHFKDLLRSMEPESILDLAIANALGRPGAKKTGQEEIYFTNRDKGRDSIEYPHECIKPILDPTFGALVFQEQVMALCHTVGGISLAETNDIRESIKHFDHKKMASFGKRIIRYANKKLGISKDTTERLWEEIKAFSEYGFNKNHSVAYSLISYQTMWLRHYYPYEYMTSFLQVFGENDKTIEFYLRVTLDMGLDVRDVDLFTSGIGFGLRKTKKGHKYIRLGFVTIKGIGEAKACKVIALRKEYKKNMVEHITPGLLKTLQEGGVSNV